MPQAWSAGVASAGIRHLSDSQRQRQCQRSVRRLSIQTDGGRGDPPPTDSDLDPDPEPAPQNWPADTPPPDRRERHRANERAARRNGYDVVADDGGATYRWRAAVDSAGTPLVDAVETVIVGGQVRSRDGGYGYETVVVAERAAADAGGDSDTLRLVSESTTYPAVETARHLLALDLAELAPGDLVDVLVSGDVP